MLKKNCCLANLRAQQMCIPFLSWVPLGTWGLPHIERQDCGFVQRASVTSPGCIGGWRRAGAHSKEEVFRVPQALDTQVGRAALVCTVWQTHTVSLNLVGKHFTVRSAPVFQLQFYYLLSLEDLGNVTHLWQGIMHCVWAQWVGWVWGARAAASVSRTLKPSWMAQGRCPAPFSFPTALTLCPSKGPT